MSDPLAESAVQKAKQAENDAAGAVMDAKTALTHAMWVHAEAVRATTRLEEAARYRNKCGLGASW